VFRKSKALGLTLKPGSLIFGEGRATEDEAQMEELLDAEKKLKKHRSADDVFADDMEDIDDLFAASNEAERNYC
jgi:hypothetical protein